MATRRRPNSSMRPSASSFGNGVHWRICHSTWADVMVSMGFSMWISWVLSDLMEFCGLFGCSLGFFVAFGMFFFFFLMGLRGFPTMRDPQSSPWDEVLDAWTRHISQLLRGRVRRESPPTGSIRSGTLDGGGFGCQESMGRRYESLSFLETFFKKPQKGSTLNISYSFRGGFLPGVFWPPRGHVTRSTPPQERLPTCQERLRADGVGPRLRCLGEDAKTWWVYHGFSQRNMGDLINMVIYWQTSVF